METEVLADGLGVVDWVLAAAALGLGMAVGQALSRIIQRRASPEGMESRLARVLGRTVVWIAALAGLLYALGILGVRLGPLLGAIGIGGIALALAAQSILANILASLIIQVRRPFRRGDQIATNEHEGRVEDINLRAVAIVNYEGERVLIPCSAVLDAAIVNHTARGRRRTSLEVGVAYGTDLPRAQQVLLEAVAATEGVLSSPVPEVHVLGFGDSSIDFALRYWHAPDIATLWRVRSAVAMAAKAALDAHEITIPFPQRDLWVRQVPPMPDRQGPED